MARTIAVGNQDFGEVVKYQSFYIDKTLFIKEWWENRNVITLITRPRRFGKTLTMSMLEYFFSVKYAERGSLFEKLDIWKEEGYRKLQGTYPVIFLSFASVKADSFDMARKKICQLLVNLYKDNEFLVDHGFLQGEDLAFFNRISIHMDQADLENSLVQLSRYLSGYYGKKVVLLLDEYDTPMQEAYLSGYWDESVKLMRGLFNAAFKTNPYLERGLMTGITRVGKESIFSDLNNLEVVTTTSRKYATTFGFTEKEVCQSLEEFGLQDKIDEVRSWYDGFRFGECEHIYNPWSITQFLDKREFAPYWANTSSNALVGKLIQKSSPQMKTKMEELMNDIPICEVLNEQIVFEQLEYNETAIWSLLLASGYLKVVNWKLNKRRKKEYFLSIVNWEVRDMFEDIFSEWFSICRPSYNDFIQALLENKLKNMNIFMNQVALQTISFFDSGNQPSGQAEPERFYHGFVLGLMIELQDRYVITSNRESGFGRYDILLEPCNQADDGMVLEFKVIEPETEKNLQDAVASAINQIINKKYAVVLEEKGVSKDRIRVYGFAFRGKEVLIDGGYLFGLEERFG